MTALDENPEIRRSRDFIDAQPGLARTFAVSPNEGSEMKKTLLITFLALVAVAVSAAGLLVALGTLGGSIDDPAVAPCRHPPTTVAPHRARPQ